MLFQIILNLFQSRKNWGLTVQTLTHASGPIELKFGNFVLKDIHSVFLTQNSLSHGIMAAQIAFCWVMQSVVNVNFT